MLSVLLILTFLLCAAASFVGLGRILARLLGLAIGEDLERMFRDFWLGFALLIALLQIWHLVRPIDWLCTLTVLLLGFAGLAVPRSKCTTKSERPPLSWKFLLILIPFVLWVAVVALSPIRNFDSGLYHFHSVRWANEYAIVPGLGNLHGRLAFNQTGFLYVAFLNAFPALGTGFNIGNALLAAIFGVQIGWSAIVFWTRPEERSLQRLFTVIFFLIFVLSLNPHGAMLGRFLSSPSPDPVAFILGALLFIRLLALIPGANTTFREKQDAAALIIVLAPVAISVKLSSLVLAASIVILAFAFLLMFGSKAVARTLCRPLLFGVVVGLSWVVRGYILSGYPAYPITLGRVDYDWTVPKHAAIMEGKWIASWARAPGEKPDTVLADWSWFGPWLDRVAGDWYFVAPFLIIGLCIFLLSALGLLKQKTDRFWILSAVSVPPFLSVVLWFASAPDPRFLGSASWCLACYLCTVLAWILAPFLPRRAPPLSVGAVLAVSILWPWISFFPSEISYLRPPGEAPVAKTVTFSTESGLVLNVPTRSDKASGDSRLPTTPYPNERLALRGEGLQSGFRLFPD